MANKKKRKRSNIKKIIKILFLEHRHYYTNTTVNDSQIGRFPSELFLSLNCEAHR